MKKTVLSSMLIAIFTLLIFISPAAADFKKTKIAVLDFQLQGSGYETTDMGKIVAEWLITALVKEGRFDVVERRLLEKLVEELKFGSSGLVDESTVAKIGKQLGAKIVITGSIMKLQNIMEVNARIIEVESGSIIAAENVKSSSTVKLEDLVIQMAEKIIKDFPLEGYIVRRENKNVIIDLGKRAGVKTSMQFIVYKEGRQIRHPKTNEVLDIEKIETGTIEVREVKDKTSDGAIIKETSNDSIKQGQLVKSLTELVPPPPPPKHTATIGDIGSLPEPVKPPPTDADLMPRLRTLDSSIDEVRQLKDSNNPGWKVKAKNVLANLKVLFGRNKTSPEIYLYYAKIYYAAGDIGDADKMLRKAFYYNPQYVEALVFKGDMYYDYAIKMDRAGRKGSGYDITARDAYEAAAKSTSDREIQATVYYRIGNIYADLAGDKENAREYWKKAVSTAQGTQAAKLANEKLKTVK